MTIRVEHADMLQAIPRLVAEGVGCDAVVTDPPYHLTAIAERSKYPVKYGKDGAMQRLLGGFMNQTWDGGDIAFRPETWATIATILRPGGFLVAFGGTRTYHRLVSAIEDAGFVIQDQIAWLFATGFPKRRDMLKPAFEPIVLAYKPGGKRTMQINECRISPHGDASENSSDSIDLLHRGAPRCCIRRTLHAWAEHGMPPIHPYSSDDGCARLWSSAINFPADCLSCRHSRDALIRMLQEAAQSGPPSRLDAPAGNDHRRREWSHIRESLCSDHLAIWDDFLRCVSSCTYMQGRDGEASANRRYADRGSTNYAATPGPRGGAAAGRWPANLCHDGSDEVVACFPQSAGQQGDVRGTEPSRPGLNCYGEFGPRKPFAARGKRPGGFGDVGAERGDPMPNGPLYADNGSAARFFFSAKAGAEDRWGSKHPTVKPVDLIAWLVKLVTPPGGTFLDPFAGSGTAAVAALQTGRNAILIEREAAYVADIRERIAFYEGGGLHSSQAKNRNRKVDHGPLFAPPALTPEEDATDSLRSYDDAMRAIGERVKAGAPVPEFLLARRAQT
jgi:DNA modification methylase